MHVDFTDFRPPLSLEGTELRNVLSHFPTGVVAITGMDDDAAVGITVGSFASVSLQPALVGFFIGHASESWQRIRRGGRFMVSVFGSDQEEVCRTLASKGRDKLAEVDWTPSLLGLPMITGARAWIQCDIDQEVTTGDHTLVLGSIINMRVANTVTGGPLLFFQGQFGSFVGMDDWTG